MEETAKAMVEHLPELEQFPLDAIDQNVKDFQGYSSFHLPQWIFLLIIVIGVIGLLGAHGVHHLEGLQNERYFQGSQEYSE